MASLCREFGISRKTGYKIFERYERCGLEGLSDRTPQQTFPDLACAPMRFLTLGAHDGCFHRLG